MSKRRTKKAALPSRHDVLVELHSIAGTPEADKLIADFDAQGLGNWVTGLRQIFRDIEHERSVGAWEDRHTNQHAVWLNTMDAAQQYVNQLWADLGYSAPPVVTPLTAEEIEERPNLVAAANEKEILLLGDGAKANLDTVICHEAAHVIVKRLGICDRHGPNWLGVYLSLLERLGRFDMAALKESAEAAGLKWAPPPIASESLVAEAA